MTHHVSSDTQFAASNPQVQCRRRLDSMRPPGTVDHGPLWVLTRQLFEEMGIAEMVSTTERFRRFRLLSGEA